MKQNKEQNNMKVVGITGGVGSGKSVVRESLPKIKRLTGRHWQKLFLEIRNDSPV